jgi:hypothetical protein
MSRHEWTARWRLSGLSGLSAQHLHPRLAAVRLWLGESGGGGQVFLIARLRGKDESMSERTGSCQL